jgi:hypothetical protein
MVKQTKSRGKAHFQCEECNLVYKEKETAEKCEAYCRKHSSCNLEIIKKAIKPGGE